MQTENDRRTIEEIAEMLEMMPEEARRRVLLYTRSLFCAKRPASPYLPLTEAQLMADISKSREETREGRAVSAREVIGEMRESV